MPHRRAITLAPHPTDNAGSKEMMLQSVLSRLWAATAAAGVESAEVMESDRNFKNKTNTTMKITRRWPHFATAGRKGQGTGRRADGNP